MLDQVSPEVTRHLEQMRSELSQTSEVTRALDRIRAIDSVPSPIQAMAREIDAQTALARSRLLELATPGFPFDSLKAELSGIFEQTRSQLSEASALARASGAIADAHPMMNQLRIPRFDFPVFPKLTFPELPQIDWGATRKAHIDGVIRLAGCGWTAPAWMSLPDVRRLGDASEIEIDDYFLQSYLSMEDGELKSIFASLLTSSEMEKWKTLIEEISDCIQRAKYQICIPALVSILEGFIAESLSKVQGTSRRETNVSASLKRAEWHKDDNFTGLMWMSVVVFLDHLFAHSDFESTTPTFINRHWILHGRSPTDWTASDALKLINALATVHWLFE